MVYTKSISEITLISDIMAIELHGRVHTKVFRNNSDSDLCLSRCIGVVYTKVILGNNSDIGHYVSWKAVEIYAKAISRYSF